MKQWAQVSSLSFLLLAGCGGSQGPEMVDIEGTLTYQGAPVSDGALELIPKPGTEARMTPVMVRNGEFSARGERGVAIGEYQVVFHSYQRTAGGDGEQEGMVIPEMMTITELLPKKYSDPRECQESLSLTPGTGSMTLNYDLTE